MKTEKITNPYYLGYLDHTEKNGEKETNHGFIIWIQSKHSKFRKQTGMIGREKDYRNFFTKWLQENK